jgi:hypothetical protein
VPIVPAKAEEESKEQKTKVSFENLIDLIKSIPIKLNLVLIVI